MIDITGINLKKFAQKVYELSQPQGLDFLHYTSEPLTDAEAEEMIFVGKVALSMDYVKGFACKMTVWSKGGRLKIQDSWYDHTDEQLTLLLDAFGIKIDRVAEHGIACNCVDCHRAKREQ